MEILNKLIQQLANQNKIAIKYEINGKEYKTE